MFASPVAGFSWPAEAMGSCWSCLYRDPIRDNHLTKFKVNNLKKYFLDSCFVFGQHTIGPLQTNLTVTQNIFASDSSYPRWVFFCTLQVTNVDDEGNELGSGIMELTQTELILHTRKRDAIRWPYLCLRRYGYDSNLFSFESGRRCQTGQGKWKCDCLYGCGFFVWVLSLTIYV